MLIFSKRKEAGLTQEKLAELSGVNRITVRRYEHGDFKNLDFYQLHNISKVINFNLLTYLQASCEDLSIDSYNKIHELYYLIANAQKDKAKQFIDTNKDDPCFKSDIGNELYCYVKALLYHDQGEFNFALDCCAQGLKTDLRYQKVDDLSKKSIIYLKIVVLSANCLGELGNIERGRYIYSKLYDFITSINETEKGFRNTLFYEDFLDFKIVTLCNMTNLMQADHNFEMALQVCNEAIDLMHENNALKYFLYLYFNKAQALYNLSSYLEAKNTLMQIYYFFIAIGDLSKLEYLKKLAISALPNISDIVEQMSI